MAEIVTFLTILACLAIAIFCYAGSAWSKKRYVEGSVRFIIGFILLFMSGPIIGYHAISGFPKTGIDPGIYKVGFIYQAGGNVSVGIEKEDGEKIEHLFLYQFPAPDFDGEIKPGAKKLVAYKLTTGDGIFNKYKLE